MISEEPPTRPGPPFLEEERYTRVFRITVTALVVLAAVAGTIATLAMGQPAFAVLWASGAVVFVYLHVTTYTKLERIGTTCIRLTRPFGTTDVPADGQLAVRNGWGGPRSLVLQVGSSRYRLVGTIGAASQVGEWLERNGPGSHRVP